MRSTLASLMAWLAILMFATNVRAKDCPDAHDAIQTLLNDPKVVKEFQETKRVDPTIQKLRIITFDHAKALDAIWRLYEWTPPSTDKDGAKVLGKLSQGTAVDLKSGVPQVALSRGEPLVLMIADTNPMLYTLEKGSTTLTASPDIANLQTILETLTSAVQTALQRPQFVPPPPPAPPLPVPAEIGTQSIHGKTPAPKKLPKAIPCNSEADEPPNELKILDEKAKTLKLVIEHLATEKTQAIAFLKNADRGLVRADETFTVPESMKAVPTVTAALDALDTARREFLNTDFARFYGCPELLAAAQAGIQVMKAATPDLSQFGSIVIDVKQASCDSIAIRERFISDLNAAKAAGDDCLTTYLINFANAANSTSKVITQTADLQSKRADFIATATTMNAFAKDVQAVSPNGNACAFSNGILISYHADDATFGQVASVPFKIASTSPLGGTYEQVREVAVDRTYNVIDRAEGKIGYGVGLVYTTVEQPTWDAVKNPLDETKLVVARTKESPRAGDLALFGNYRFGRVAEKRIVPGIQFGAGVSSTLELFLGVSFEARILRVGIGLTTQQVDILRDQRELRRNADGTVDPNSITVVGAKTDIQTRSGFSTRPYISVTLSLDGFSFIRKKQ